MVDLDRLLCFDPLLLVTANFLAAAQAENCATIMDLLPRHHTLESDQDIMKWYALAELLSARCHEDLPGLLN